MSLASYRVTDKYNTLSLTLDPDDTNVKFKIIKDGEEITLADIREWDNLSVALDNPANPAEEKVINVQVSRNSVTGKVVEIEDEKIRINDTSYEIADNYTSSAQPEIRLDDEGTFYIDIEGKIAAVDTTVAEATMLTLLMPK